jgi:hypothetical protein
MTDPIVLDALKRACGKRRCRNGLKGGQSFGRWYTPTSGVINPKKPLNADVVGRPASDRGVEWATAVKLRKRRTMRVSYRTATLRANPRSHWSSGIDAATRLAYRVQQVGNERIVTPLLQPGRANRAKLHVFGRHGERGKAISAAR